MAEPKYVNGFVDGGDLVLLYRDAAGQMMARRKPAEWSSFFRTEDVNGALQRDLRNSSHVAGLSIEGEWTRVRWQAPEWRRKIFGLDRGEQHDYFFEDLGIRHYEADVDPVRRFFSDSGAAVARPRRAYLDIETDPRVPPALARQGKARVLCWSAVDEDQQLIARAVLEDWSDDAEARLLEAFWAAMEPYDQLVAWYGDGFDFPILRQRAETVGARTKDFRRWLYIDQMVVFERNNKNSAESGDEKVSLKLQDVAMAKVGEGKQEFDVTKGFVEWEAGGERRQRLLDYCTQDTKLLPKIEAATGYLALNDAVCEVCRLFANTSSASPSIFVDGFMLRLGVERGHHFPTRKWVQEDEKTHKKFKGAWVMEPTRRGIVKNVHVADFSGMYPSIIETWNMSPETKRLVPFSGPIPAGHCRAPATRVGFALEPQGILAFGVEEIGRLRKFWSKRQAELPPGTPEWRYAGQLSMAFKVVRNSFYGVAGSPASRYFDREIAESITQNGVWLIQMTIGEGNRRGFECIYGDSLTGDRTVVLRSPDGRTRILPIEQAFSMADDHRVARGKEFGSLNGWSALARDREGREGWFPVGAIIRHRVGKKVIRVSTKRGQTEVTTDHGIMIGRDCVTPAEFVEKGAAFEVVRSTPGRNLESIDLFDYVRDHRFTRPCKREVSIRGFGADDSLVFQTGTRLGLSTYAVRRFYASGSPELKALLRLVGAYLSEGSSCINGVTATRWGWSIAQKRREWLDALESDLALICSGVSMRVSPVGGGMYALRSDSSFLPCLFTSLCGCRSRGKRLPDFAYDLADGDDVVQLVKWMVDGDGSWDGKQLRYTTISQQLIAGLSYVLDQRSLEHSIHFRPSKRSWTLRTRPDGSERDRARVHVEERVASNEHVYDLHVEGANTFVDGVGRVLVHNTDATNVTNTTRERFAEFVTYCNRELYPPKILESGCRLNRVEIAYEKEFERIVYVSAKHYTATWRHYKWITSCTCAKPNGQPGALDIRTMTCRDCGKLHAELPPPRGEPEVKGLEYKRGDASALARKLQWEVIQKLMVDLSENPADFVPIVERMRSHVFDDPLPVKEVQLSKSISKSLKEYATKPKKDGTPGEDLAHVKVGKILKARGEQVVEGSRIFYYVVDASVSPMIVAPATDYAGDVDRHYIWMNLVWPPTQRLLAAAFPDQDWREFDVKRPRRNARQQVEMGWKPVSKVGRARPAPVGQGALFELPAPAASTAHGTKEERGDDVDHRDVEHARDDGELEGGDS